MQESIVESYKWIMFLYPLLSALIGAVTAMIVTAFKTGRLAQRIDSTMETTEEIERTLDTIKGELPSFIKRSDCLLTHREQQEKFCKKIDDVHFKLNQVSTDIGHQLEIMDRKREGSREESEKLWRQIFGQLGGMETAIQSIQKQVEGLT